MPKITPNNVFNAKLSQENSPERIKKSIPTPKDTASPATPPLKIPPLLSTERNTQRPIASNLITTFIKVKRKSFAPVKNTISEKNKRRAKAKASEKITQKNNFNEKGFSFKNIGKFSPL